MMKGGEIHAGIKPGRFSGTERKVEFEKAI
jgi:hypothetical protein